MTSQLMEPIVGDEYEPTEDEVREYAQALGFVLPDDNDLLYIAREGLKAPLPADWRVASTAEGDIYYYHKDKREPTWDHPMDNFYKKKFEEEKAKKNDPLKFSKVQLPKESTAEKILTGTSSTSGSPKSQRGSVEQVITLSQHSGVKLSGSPSSQPDMQSTDILSNSVIPTVYREFQSPLSGSDSKQGLGNSADNIASQVSPTMAVILTGLKTAQQPRQATTEASSPTEAQKDTAGSALLPSASATALIDLSKQHAKELAELSKAHSATIAEICERNAQDIIKLREEHTEGIRKMKRDLNEEYKKEYNTLRKEFDSKVAELREAHDKQMKKLDSIYSDEVRQAKQKYDNLLSDRDGYERRISSLKEEQSQLIAQINTLEQSIANFKATVTKLSTQQKELQTTVQNTQAAQNMQSALPVQSASQPPPAAAASPLKICSPVRPLLHAADLDAFFGLGNFIIYCLPDPARFVLLSEVLRLRVIGDYLKQEKKRTDLRVKAIEARRTAFVTQSKIVSDETNIHGAFQTSNPAIRKIYEERKQIDAESKDVNQAISTYRQSSDWLADRKVFTNTLLRFLISSLSRSSDLLVLLASLFNEYTEVFENRATEFVMPTISTYDSGRLSTGFLPLNSLETPDARSARESKAEPGPSRKQKESYIRSKVLETLQISDYKFLTNVITHVYGTVPNVPLDGDPESLSSSAIVNHLSVAIGANNVYGWKVQQHSGDFYLERSERLPLLVAKLWHTGADPVVDKVEHGDALPPKSPERGDVEKRKVVRGEEYINEKGQKIIVPAGDPDFVVLVPDAPPPKNRAGQRHHRRLYSPETILLEKEQQAREAAQVKAPSTWIGEYRTVTKGYA